MKKTLNSGIRIMAAAAGIAFMTGCIASGDSSADGASAARAAAAAAQAPEDKAEKVTICHMPPGNPENMHTLSVGAPAVRAHLDHGDALGACGDDVVIDDGGTNDGVTGGGDGGVTGGGVTGGGETGGGTTGGGDDSNLN